jgi:hypothetical protein
VITQTHADWLAAFGRQYKTATRHSVATTTRKTVRMTANDYQKAILRDLRVKLQRLPQNTRKWRVVPPKRRTAKQKASDLQQAICRKWRVEIQRDLHLKRPAPPCWVPLTAAEMCVRCIRCLTGVRCLKCSSCQRYARFARFWRNRNVLEKGLKSRR